MRYTFRSQTETVYLNVDYQLVILSSSGTTLKDGSATLSAVVRRVSDGSTVDFEDSCFTWKRHEDSDGFTPVTGPSLVVSSDMLVNGSATFICEFSKEGLFWKDTANISLSATNQGANAPYQRTIYKVSETKPETPPGDASELPSGWSLQPPPRVNNWKVWASVAYVSFEADNTPIYSSWSDPVEWTGETVLPRVEWAWGDSAIYPPNVTKSILVIDGSVMVFSDENETVAFTDDDDGYVWSEEFPTERVPGKPYLWKREYNYQHTSEEDEWFYYPVNGIPGLDGAYQSIGYIIVGTNSVIFAGLDEDKNPTLPLIHIFIEDMSYYFKSIQVTLNEKSDIFYLVATLSETGVGELHAVYIDYIGTGSTYRTAWKDHLTDAEVEDGFILAEIRMNGASIKSVTITVPRRFDAQEKIAFMELLNSGNMDDINIAAKALGVERVFTKLAALEAFINQLHVRYVNLYGYIKGGGYDSSGNKVGSGKGVYLDASGTLKATNASFDSASVSGDFHTYDSTGTIFKTSKDIFSQTYQSRVNDAYLKYTYTSATLNLPNDYLFRLTTSSVYYKQIPMYVSYLDSDLISRYEYDNFSTDITPANEDISEYYGGIIEASGSYQLDLSETVNISITCPDNDLIAICELTISGTFFVGTFIVAAFSIISGEESKESHVLFTDNSGTKNCKTFAYLTNLAKDDEISFGINKLSQIPNDYAATLKVYLISKTDKTFQYNAADGILTRPYGYQNLFLVEDTGYDTTKDIPITEYKRLSIYKENCTESAPPNVGEYSGPVLRIYNSNKSLIGNTNQPSTLYSNGLSSLYSDYSYELGLFEEGEYETSSSSRLGTAIINKFVVRTDSSNGKTIDLYGSRTGNTSEENFLTSIYKGARFESFTIIIVTDERGIETASIFPVADNLYSIGSLTKRFKDIHAVNAHFNVFSADSIDIGGSNNPRIVNFLGGFGLYLIQIYGNEYGSDSTITVTQDVPSDYSIWYNLVFGFPLPESIDISGNKITMTVDAKLDYSLAVLIKAVGT